MSDSLQFITPSPKGFRGKQLDYLLASGFYRMQHLMFTCNETIINNEWRIIPVFWLRTLVNNCILSSSAKNILKKCNHFRTSVQSAYVDDEIEALYAVYKEHVQFEVSPTCTSYLHQQELPEPFDSMMIKVYEGATLIAVGFFDKGSQTIAGLMNIYHPQYRSFSPGKFLMLQKLKYALSQRMKFYYTGYISPESTRFDYKTFPDPQAVEVLLPAHKQWIPYHALGKTFLAEYYTSFLTQD